MRNGIFHVAKEEGSDRVLGVACWLRPQEVDKPRSWNDWLEDWRLWMNQVSMNLLYGRGGLVVKVSLGRFVSDLRRSRSAVRRSPEQLIGLRKALRDQVARALVGSWHCVHTPHHP